MRVVVEEVVDMVVDTVVDTVVNTVVDTVVVVAVVGAIDVVESIFVVVTSFDWVVFTPLVVGPSIVAAIEKENDFI